jgi:hypothetical protein
LTESYLCGVCSCQEILRRSGADSSAEQRAQREAAALTRQEVEQALRTAAEGQAQAQAEVAEAERRAQQRLAAAAEEAEAKMQVGVRRSREAFLPYGERAQIDRWIERERERQREREREREREMDRSPGGRVCQGG